jgi:hypothetical protein
MARKPNIYVLLKNVEAFVKSVPIESKARNRKKWRKDQAEAAKALKKVYAILGSINVIELPAIAANRIPCGVIPQKQVTSLILIPEKKALPAYINICTTIPTRKVLEQVAPIVKKN